MNITTQEPAVVTIREPGISASMFSSVNNIIDVDQLLSDVGSSPAISDPGMTRMSINY